MLMIAAGVGAIVVVVFRRTRRVRARTRPADVGFMRSMHAAMRRDLARLHAVAARTDGRLAPETVRDGFGELRREIEFHHHAEDDDLWPLLRERAPGYRADLITDEMVREHAQIPPALDRVARAFDGDGDLLEAADALRNVVERHLDHEEHAALPLVERFLNDAEWHDFLHTERRKRPASERPTFLAWVLDEAAPDDAAAVLRELPPPGRVVYRRVMKPRYEARRLWSIDGDVTERGLVESDSKR
jgi:hemerythrin-like domain-containing protein